MRGSSAEGTPLGTRPGGSKHVVCLHCGKCTCTNTAALEINKPLPARSCAEPLSCGRTMRLSRSPRSPGASSSRSPAPASSPCISDHDLIVLSARDPEAAQVELGRREALGVSSSNSVRNAVAVGVAGKACSPQVVRSTIIDTLDIASFTSVLSVQMRGLDLLLSGDELERERQAEAQRVEAAAAQLAYTALSQAAGSVLHLRQKRLTLTLLHVPPSHLARLVRHALAVVRVP